MHTQRSLLATLITTSITFSSLFSLQRTYPLIAKLAKPYIHKTFYPTLNLVKPASLIKPHIPTISNGSFMGQETPINDEVHFRNPQFIDTPKSPQEQLFLLAKRGDIDKVMSFWQQISEPGRLVLVEATNEAGNTAFMCAVAYRNLEVTQFLFTAGSDRFAKNHAGKRAMDIALENEDLHMMLLLIQK